MQKRGQAAIEFIMTYGWVIMGVLLSISALAYYGTLNPDQFLPNTCVLDFGIVCADFKVQQEDVTVVLINGKWDDLQINNINVTGCTGTASGSLEYRAQKKFIISGCSNQEGRKFTGDINVSYFGHSNLTHKNTGRIISRVEPGCGLCACQNIDTNCGSYPTCTNCNDQDAYSANYCSGSSIIRDFNDYSCLSNSCTLSSIPETVENCVSSNGVCQSAACVCANTASSCGTYPVCSDCGTNKTCYQLGCLWNLSGTWTLSLPGGNEQVTLVQTGTYVEAILLDGLSGPGQPGPGDWILRFTISGGSIAGDANNQPDPSPNNILNYRGTIISSGTYIDAEFEYPRNSGTWIGADVSKN